MYLMSQKVKSFFSRIAPKGQVEIFIHAVVAVFILGFVWRGYNELADKVYAIDNQQSEMHERLFDLERKTDDITQIRSRLDNIVDNQKQLRKLLIESIRSDRNSSSDSEN